MYEDLIVYAASYDANTDTLTVHAMSGVMELHYSFRGNNFSVESPNDVVDAWIAIPAMIELLAKETRDDDAIAHVDAALRLAAGFCAART